jgi:hypothetical protein
MRCHPGSLQSPVRNPGFLTGEFGIRTENIYDLFFFLIYRTAKIITPENARACCGYLTPYTRGVRAILVETLNASCLPM